MNHRSKQQTNQNKTRDTFLNMGGAETEKSRARDPILKMEKVSKRFGGVKALTDVSLKVYEGDVLGIIGPNGSGKTTIVNCITGFIKPTRGQIFFKGKEITGKKPHKIADMGITRTFQIMRPYYSLPAFKNLVIPLFSPRARRTGGWRGGGRLGDRKTVAIDILEEIGFERDSYIPFKTTATLPTGYLKRLELARCLSLKPEIIICDEVFSGLSMSEIASMVPLIQRLQDDGITIVMIEHRLRELFQVANQVMVLNFGEKLIQGTPEAVMADDRVKTAYFGSEAVEEVMTMLDAGNLMVFYENMLALNNISLFCGQNSIVGVFGANSAGKSTLMYALSGIMLDIARKEKMAGGERITLAGSLTFMGKDIMDMKPSLRARSGIILCPERRRLFKESSVLENLKIGGYLATKAQAKKTMDLVMAVFPALKALRSRLGGFLSGGEQQMVAIGRALMAQPKILLLDEPLLGLSPLMQATLVKATRAIQKESKISIIVSEQYARPVFPIVDYAYILENGAAVMEGTRQELMDNPDVKSAYFGV